VLLQFLQIASRQRQRAVKHHSGASGRGDKDVKDINQGDGRGLGTGVPRRAMNLDASHLPDLDGMLASSCARRPESLGPFFSEKV
jgi:hypothetical protein